MTIDVRPGRQRPTVLVVSEDPGYIDSVYDRLTPLGATVVGCLGPASSPCQLDVKKTCSLASHARIVLIDAPPSGDFYGRSASVSAADYASRLAQAHPGSLILVSGVPEGSGPTGDAICVIDREQATNVAAYSAMTAGIDLETV